MKNFLIIMMLIGLASFSATAQTGENQASGSKTEQEVVAVYRQYVDALVKKDGVALERILAESFADTDTIVGATTNREHFFAPYKNGAISAGSLESVDTSKPIVSIHKKTAVLTSRAAFNGKAKDGQTYSVPVLLTFVFTKEQGRWQIVSTHASRIDKLQAVSK